jgi:hypothetical protein
MQRVQAAAMAPANPSGADQHVSSVAAAYMAQAAQQLATSRAIASGSSTPTKRTRVGYSTVA